MSSNASNGFTVDGARSVSRIHQFRFDMRDKSLSCLNKRRLSSVLQAELHELLAHLALVGLKDLLVYLVGTEDH